MKNIIYYFSGRGNSLHIAQELSARLEDTTVVSITQAVREKIDPDAERIGIITNVIDIGIPAYVDKFIRTLRFSGKKPYVFAVVANGGMPGASMDQLKKGFRKQEVELSAGFLVKFGLEAEGAEAWKKRMDDMANAIRQKQKLPLGKTTFGNKLMTGLGNPLARLLIPSEDKKFKVNSSCNGCGICQKICPVSDIKMIDDKPVWLHHCTQCAACFSWCPREAIYGTNLASRTHYRNPNVKLEQMIKLLGL